MDSVRFFDDLNRDALGRLTGCLCDVFEDVMLIYDFCHVAVGQPGLDRQLMFFQ